MTLPTCAGCRRSPAVPALWLSASTGVRRSELLGLQRHDLNVEHARLWINRGLEVATETAELPDDACTVVITYEVRETASLGVTGGIVSESSANGSGNSSTTSSTADATDITVERVA